MNLWYKVPAICYGYEVMGKNKVNPLASRVLRSKTSEPRP